MLTDLQFAPDVALEKHYTVFELAELWGVNHNTIRRLFKNEPDVLRFGSEETRYGRKRVTITIPASVAKRVHSRRFSYTNPAQDLSNGRIESEGRNAE